MNYVELDVNNLARWFSGAIGTSGSSTIDKVVAPNNFVVYFSDRRGNYAPAGRVTGTWPPLSPSGNETGEYGFSDFVNPADKNACPNNVLDAGEDLDGLGSPTGFFTYGEIPFRSPAAVASVFADGSSLNATVADPNCPTGSAGINPWPGTYLVYPNEGRQNPPSLLRQRRQRNPSDGAIRSAALNRSGTRGQRPRCKIHKQVSATSPLLNRLLPSIRSAWHENGRARDVARQSRLKADAWHVASAAFP